MPVTEEEVTVAEVDRAIEKMENLYRAVTGQEPPEAGKFPIPVEKEPAQFVEEQIDRLLERLGESTPTEPRPTAEAPTWAPPVWVLERDKELVVGVDLPGVARRDVTILIDGGSLAIRGRRSMPMTDATLRFAERPFGSFERLLRLAPNVRWGEPKAKLDEGVLEIRIPREAATAGPVRSVPVQ